MTSPSRNRLIGAQRTPGAGPTHRTDMVLVSRNSSSKDDLQLTPQTQFDSPQTTPDLAKAVEVCHAILIKKEREKLAQQEPLFQFY